MLHSARTFSLSMLVFIVASAIFTFISLPPGYYFVGGSLCAIFAFTSRKSKVFGIIFIILAVTSLAAFRVNAANERFENSGNNPKVGADVTLTGFIVDEPEVIGKSQSFVLEDKAKTKYEIRINQFPTYEFGDYLKVTGKITEVKNGGRDKAKGVVAFVSYPAVEIAVAPKNYFIEIKSVLVGFRKRLEGNISRILPEPAAGLLNGILFGTRADISTELLSVLTITGTMHIIALSGFNITIIAEGMRSAFKNFKREFSFWLPILGILVFVLATGGSASVVRAAIMGVILIWAGKAGRQPDALNAILFSAAVMVMANPFIVLYDVGFQLSFAATIGIVFLARRFDRVFSFLGPVFGPNTAATFAALIFTYPLISIYFGRVSLIAPFANLLVLPIIPYIMFLGLGAALAVYVSFYFAKAIGLLVWLMLNYIIKSLETLAKTSYASLNYKITNWSYVLAYYLFVFDFLLLKFKNA